MKKILFLIITSSVIWMQCDANNDGNLDVLDIIDQVNCILDGCWYEEEPTDSSIYDYWMMDSGMVEVTIDGITQTDSFYCGDFDYYYDYYNGDSLGYYQSDAFVLNLNENNFAYEYYIDPMYCGEDEVPLNSADSSYPISVDGSTLILYFDDDYYPMEFTFMVLNEDTLTMFLDYSQIDESFVGGVTYIWHRVSPSYAQSMGNNKGKILPFFKNNQKMILDKLPK